MISIETKDGVKDKKCCVLNLNFNNSILLLQLQTEKIILKVASCRQLQGIIVNKMSSFVTQRNSRICRNQNYEITIVSIANYAVRPKMTFNKCRTKFLTLLWSRDPVYSRDYLYLVIEWDSFILF